MKNIKNTIGVKFFPSSLEYKEIKSSLHLALDEVGESGNLILGNNVQKIEKIITKLTNKKFTVGCASGTDALTIAIEAIGLEPKDEVIIPANSYPTAFGVALGGAKIVLADVEKESGNLDYKDLKKKITKKTKAVVVVHLYGLPANLENIKKICSKYKLILIEDCAQAFGARYKGKLVGSFGEIAVFSFYPTKNLGALGDGGAISTNNYKIYEKLLMLRSYGEKKRYESEFLGKNSRLDELQAAFLITKFPYLKDWIKIRKQLAKVYMRELKNIQQIKLPIYKNNTFHLYPLKIEN